MRRYDLGRWLRSLAGVDDRLLRQVWSSGPGTRRWAGCRQGRRRYVDVELRTRRGKKMLVEIDGAVHLIVGTYWSDMARANEIVIAGQSLLRFPTVTLYLDEAAVVDQLRRSLDD